MRNIRISLVGVFMSLVLCAHPLAANTTLPDFTELVQDSAAAVVNISTTREQQRSRQMMPFDIPGQGQIPEIFRHFFERQFPPMPDADKGRKAVPQSLGSGFLISDDGYILTNHHVIAEAEEILVRLNDRREMLATLVGSDEHSDLALLKIDATDLPYLHLDDSNNLQVGEWVLAIGSPFGFDYTVTAGIVSAKGRSLQSDTYVPFIQTDVAINPGNSGGPLFNLSGKVVGINSQIYTRSGGFMGLSFAIPSNTAKNIVSQLRESGQVMRGWLGVRIQEVNQELAESFGLDKAVGALIADVMENSPAAAAGLQAGDIITHVNNKEVIKSGQVVHFIGAIAPQTDVMFTLVRDGDVENISVTIGSLADAERLAQDAAKENAVYVERLGLKVASLTEEQAEEMRLSYGVIITKIDAETASQLDLRVGDVITAMANRRVVAPQQFAELAEALPNGRSISMRVVRNGHPMYQAFRLSQ
jgi:serine protease Do